jgi:hypothetical protein
VLLRGKKRNFLKNVGFHALAFLGLGLYLSAPWSMYEMWRASKTWKETPAVVTAIENVERVSDYLELSPHLRVYYEYRFDGKRHKDFTRGANLKQLKVGDTISVYVDPDKPRQSVFKRSEFLWSAWLGLICIVAGVWLAWKWLTTSPFEKWGGSRYHEGM